MSRTDAVRVTSILSVMLLASAGGTPAHAASGIPGYSVMAWTTKDGVYPGPFRAVAQDRDGYIWLGISVDLVRFDGVRFVTWSELSEDPLRNGGVVTALLDHVGGLAVFSTLTQPGMVATLDLRIDYQRPAEVGQVLFAEAHCYRKTRSIAFVRASAYHDDPNHSVATAQARSSLGPPR